MVDLLCLDDLDEYGRELDDPLEELAQDVFHMLLETYGSNPDVPTRGIGLEDALSGVVDDTLAHRIETQLTEDERIDAAKVTISETSPGTYRIDVEIQANDEELGLVVTREADGTITRSRS